MGPAGRSSNGGPEPDLMALRGTRRGHKGVARAGQTHPSPRRAPDVSVPDSIRREVRFFTDRAQLRAWFERHHASASEIWIGYYKQGVSRAGVRYAEALDEALCFGWIDGQVRSLDGESYANRYTPRRPGSNWSAPNVQRARELARAGRMHEAGLRAFAPDRKVQRSPRVDGPANARLPRGLERELRADPRAWERFQGEPPGYRRQAVAWVSSARTPETVRRRLAALMSAAREGRRVDWIHPYRVPRRRGAEGRRSNGRSARKA